MLQWMGGSRRKVTTSRQSMQKRQKQYFEQRKRQQQYQQQTTRLESYDDGMDISAPHHKEHRSLDIISLLNLSTIAQDCKPACPSRKKDLGVNASKMEFGTTNQSPVILSNAVVPADSVEFKETRTPSGFQVNTASPNKISSSAPDGHENAPSGVISKPDKWNTTAEQQLSILDLLYDDGWSGNMEEDIVHEAHVAFSVEGLGKVGTETPVHSPQQPNRSFSYGFSSSPKAAGWMKSSKKFNTLLDDFEFEMDAGIHNIGSPLDSNPFEFSLDITDSLRSPKQRSFAVREAMQHDGYSGKKNMCFGHHNEDYWDDRTNFQYRSFFDEREPDISQKTWQSRNDDDAADNLTYRDYDMSDFAFGGPHSLIRTTRKATDKNDVVGSTFSFSKHETSEYDGDFLISNQARHPTVEKKFDFKPVTKEPDRFSFMAEYERNNSSLQSEESCSSSAVKYQQTDTAPSDSVSRQGRGFNDPGDKYNVKKAFSKESKDNVQQKKACGSGKCTNMLNSSDLKSRPHSTSFSQENLGTRDIWYFKEGHTTVDINPGSSPFNQSSGAKHKFFDSQFWGEDPLSQFHTPKSCIGVDPLGDGFDSEPVAYTTSNCFTSKKIPLHDSSTISKADFPLDSELRHGHQGSPYTAGFQGETPSPDLSAQESKDDGKINLEISNFCDTVELGKEICAGNEDLVSEEKDALEASHSENIERETREGKDVVLKQSERQTTTVLPKPVEKTSQSVDMTDKSRSIKDEKRDIHTDKIPHHQNGSKENVEDFRAKGRMGGKEKSDYVDSSCQAIKIQSYVFHFFCAQKRLKY